MSGSSQGGSTGKDSSSKESLADTISKEREEKILEDFQRISIIDEETAELILSSGFTSLKDIAEADIEKLSQIDELDDDKAEKIKEEAEELSEDEDESEDELTQWLTGESDEDLGGLLDEEIEGAKEGKIATESEDSSSSPTLEEDDHQALKAWLSGEQDSISEWLGEESFEEEKEEIQEELAEKETELEETKDEIETLKQQLTSKLEEIETGEYDAEELIQENAELREEANRLEGEIEELREEKNELEEEMEEIKQGSVAMVKYLKNQKKKDAVAAGGDELDEASQERIKELEEENEELREKIDRLESTQPSEDLSDMADSEVKEELGRTKDLLEQKKEEVEEKNRKIQDLQDDLSMKKEELEDLREKLEYKENELQQREEDLEHREEVIRKERQELQQLKDEFGGTTEKERKRRLQELEKEIDQKEQELKAKEEYIDQKERELRAREEELIDEEIEEREEEILQEIEQEKAKTGTPRLDDLMLGGIPLGSNVSIYGPPHVGKEVMVNTFMAEGIEKGVPAIWVTTDKTIEDIREEMKYVLPTYGEYEKRGIIYYVDAYSSSMGEIDEEEREKDYVAYIEEQSDVKAITQQVDEFADEIKKDNKYYRMAFESVSTLIAYLDTATTFRTLQPFSGRRKKDKAVSMYTLEKGMHTEQDISMLGHMMDGEMEFQVQDLETKLRVQGLGDVQTRDWVKYNSSKTGITMGSFSLDTIR